MQRFLFFFLLLFSRAFSESECFAIDPPHLRSIKKEEIQIIVEIGSYQGKNARALSLYYQKPVYAFECDPLCFKCFVKSKRPFPEVILVPYKAWNRTGSCVFYFFENNSSSYYEEYLCQHYCLEEEFFSPFFRSRVYEVNTLRLDDWLKSQHFKSIDLLWLDDYTSCLKIFEGTETVLGHVRYIILRHDPLLEAYFPDKWNKIRTYLEKRHYRCIHDHTGLFPYVLFVNKNFTPG